MNPVKLRRNFVVVLAAALSLAVPAQAAKRRAASTRSPGAPFTLEKITGQVIDSVTGQAVALAAVSAGNRNATTDAQGNFELKNVKGDGYLIVEVDRSGYKPYSAQFKPNDPVTLTVRVVPTRTATLRKTNGEVLEIDMESIKFGYPVPFSGYRDAESDDFCALANGQKSYIHRAQMAKLAGPATVVSGAACCESGEARKVTLTLKSGQVMDVVFTDTCADRYQVDVGARIHSTGAFVHVPITDIAEIVFP